MAFKTPADLQREGQRIDRLDGPRFFRRLICRIGTLVESHYCRVGYAHRPWARRLGSVASPPYWASPVLSSVAGLWSCAS